MKVVYKYEVETHKAFSRKGGCPKCGNKTYEIVEQIEPKTATPWFIYCPNCQEEGYPSITRYIALKRWRHGDT